MDKVFPDFDIVGANVNSPVPDGSPAFITIRQFVDTSKKFLSVKLSGIPTDLSPVYVPYSVGSTLKGRNVSAPRCGSVLNPYFPFWLSG